MSNTPRHKPLEGLWIKFQILGLLRAATRSPAALCRLEPMPLRQLPRGPGHKGAPRRSPAKILPGIGSW